MKSLAPACVALALACGAGLASGASPTWPDALTGRLQHIKETRSIRLGYRENAVPFSYLAKPGNPVGYSLDLCHEVVTAIAEDLGVPLKIDYVPVTAQNRIERVLAGAVDLECGSTTNTAQRRSQVAFSPVIFITGTRLAVPRGSRVHDVKDLRARTVAVVRGTTNETAMREVDRLRKLAIKFIEADGYREALALLDAGRADAIAADEVLLRGMTLEIGRARDFRLVGEMLSFESYGIMLPRDDAALADAVDRTLRALAQNREIIWIYNRWFLRPLPSGQSLNLPMSAQLRRSLELIGLPPD